MPAPRSIFSSRYEVGSRLRQMRRPAPVSVMSSPPTLSWLTASGIASAKSIAANAENLAWRHTTPVDRGSGFYGNGHVSFGTVGVTMDGNIGSVCFYTDAPVIEAKLRYAATGSDRGKIGLRVDDQEVSVTHSESDVIYLPRYQQTDLLKIDFGSDAKVGAAIGASVSAGGSGHAVGDILTLTGGTFSTAAKLKVLSVTAGAVTAATVLEPGSYTAQPTNPVSVGSTTGAGTGATFTLTWGAKNSVRRERKIELFFSRDTWFQGLNVGQYDTVRPASACGPRVVLIGDSIPSGFHTYRPQASFAAQAMAMLGVEDWWVSGLPGTGWLTASGSSVKLRDRLSTDINPLKADLIVIAGFGYNDNAQSASPLQTEVETTLSALLAANPMSYVVHIGSFIGNSTGTPSSALRTAIATAYTNVADTTRCKFYDPVSLGWFTGGVGGPFSAGTGNAGFFESSDAIHPHQEGHNHLATLTAAVIDLALRDLLIVR